MTEWWSLVFVRPELPLWPANLLLYFIEALIEEAQLGLQGVRRVSWWHLRLWAARRAFRLSVSELGRSVSRRNWALGEWRTRSGGGLTLLQRLGCMWGRRLGDERDDSLHHARQRSDLVSEIVEGFRRNRWRANRDVGRRQTRVVDQPPVALRCRGKALVAGFIPQGMFFWGVDRTRPHGCGFARVDLLIARHSGPSSSVKMLRETTVCRGLGADAAWFGSECAGIRCGAPRGSRGGRSRWSGWNVTWGWSLTAASGRCDLAFVLAHRSGRKLGPTPPTIKSDDVEGSFSREEVSSRFV